jgi:hypothetical protein
MAKALALGLMVLKKLKLGTMYTGNWKDDQFHGFGKLSYPNKDTYEGNFESGKAQGQGKFTHANGTVYVGGWLEDKQHGSGKELYAGILLD